MYLFLECWKGKVGHVFVSFEDILEKIQQNMILNRIIMINANNFLMR